MKSRQMKSVKDMKSDEIKDILIYDADYVTQIV